MLLMLSDNYPVLEQVCLGPSAEWKPPLVGWMIVHVDEGIVYFLAARRVCELQPGDLIVIRPNVAFVIRVSQIVTAKLHFCCFRPELLPHLLTLSEGRDLALLARDAREFYYLPAPETAAKQFGEVCRTHSKGLPFVERASLLRVAAAIFAPYLTMLRPNLRAASNSASARFLKLMHTLPEAEILQHSISDLAKYCGCSSRYLNTLFRECFGDTLRARQLQFRFDLARRLLAETDSRIANVALRCGYRSISAFEAAFRKSSGMTPEQWRQCARTDESALLSQNCNSSATRL